MSAAASAPTDTIWQLITAIGTCMMVTQDAERVRSRPMRGIARPEENAIWFFTDRGSAKSLEIGTGSPACLSYADMSRQNYVSVSGEVELIDDEARRAELWTEGAATYYTDGKDDARIQLLKFTPEFGEYWDSPSNPILLAIKFLQAKVSGIRPDLGTTGSAHMA